MRTTNCLDPAGAPITYIAEPPAWPADASSSIQAAIDLAHAHAGTIRGTCTVRAYIPSGTWRIDSTLFVPGRVHLFGADLSSTKLVKIYGGLGDSAIELKDRTLTGCPIIAHLSVQNFEIARPTRRHRNWVPGTVFDRAQGSPNSMKLTRCRFYGIGLQYVSECMQGGGPYSNFTIKGVRLDWAGSDGIDMKASSQWQNYDGELHNLCLTNIGQAGDGNWDSALDLAGDQLWVAQVTAINSALLTQTAGIDLGADARRVTNSTVESFYVKRFDLGFTAGAATGNVVVRNGALKVNTVGANLAWGTYNIDTQGAYVCRSMNGTDLVNAGSGNDWSWGACPALETPASSCSRRGRTSEEVEYC